MWDFLFRAILRPNSYWGILKKHELTFSHRIDEGNRVYSFIFETDKPLTWSPGEHGVFSFPQKKIEGKSWRAFSIASSEIEGQIRIATNIPDLHSDFKDKLLNLSPGDKISLRGPFGEFRVSKNTKQMVGIAGGIGITPFRAIMYEIAKNKLEGVNLHLIYAGKENYFTYEDKIHNFSNHPNIIVEFVNTPDEVNAKIDSSVQKFGNHAEYFISGSPGMIKAVQMRLKKQGIRKIFNDPFKGY